MLDNAQAELADSLSAANDATTEVLKHAAEHALTASGGFFLFGLTIGQINEYLHAVAMIFGIVASGCAAYYYIKAGRSKK